MTELTKFAYPEVTREEFETIFENGQSFSELMMQYGCALREITTKFEVLNDEFTVRYKRNPVESIKTRIKTPKSLIDKLQRKGLEFNMANIRYKINDVAGIRVICSYPEDIYTLAEMLIRQDDITVIEIKDYIKNPKPSGYRSYHLIVGVPIFLTETTEIMDVEVQFRTIAMDFWASLEHELKYKQDIDNADEIADRLKVCADKIADVDLEMQEIYHMIEN